MSSGGSRPRAIPAAERLAAQTSDVRGACARVVFYLPRSMTSSRERLRLAAADLAESLYDLLSQDFLAGAGPGRAHRAPQPRAIPADNVQVLTDWIHRHPGANPTAMMKGLRWGNSKLFEVLKAALTSGSVRKERSGSVVRYVVAGGTLDALRTGSPSAVVVELRGRVVDYIAQHPGASPREMMRGLRASRSSLFRALLAAIEAGELEKVGSPPAVVYKLPGVDLSATLGAPPFRRRTAAPPPADEGLIAQVTAFVVAHPHCRFRDIRVAIPQTERALNNALRGARARGAIRLEGAKIKSRYVAASLGER